VSPRNVQSTRIKRSLFTLIPPENGNPKNAPHSHNRHPHCPTRNHVRVQPSPSVSGFVYTFHLTMCAQSTHTLRSSPVVCTTDGSTWSLLRVILLCGHTAVHLAFSGALLASRCLQHSVTNGTGGRSSTCPPEQIGKFPWADLRASVS
jgi:hypothetical protein